MKHVDTFKGWHWAKQTVISIAAVVVAVVGIWQGVLPVLAWVHPAEAAISEHQILTQATAQVAMSQRDSDLREVRRQIQDYSDKIIETRYRPDLNGEQKDKLIGSYENSIIRLRQIEECLMDGLPNCY